MTATYQSYDRHLVGRVAQALLIGKGSRQGASIYAGTQAHWGNRAEIKAVIDGLGTGDFAGANQPLNNAFLAAMRSYSVPMRLQALRRVPMLTRLFVNSQGVIAARHAEGQPLPILRGSWTTHTLAPIRHAGLLVQTDDLIKSTSQEAAAAIGDDLAKATADIENRSFIHPDETTSILNSAENFSGSGSTLANIDADLKKLCGMVPGIFRQGAAFIMTAETATYLSLLRGTGDAAAYPGIGPQGGTLLGIPVLVTDACAIEGSPATRIIALASSSEIFWADDPAGIELTLSNQAALQMSDAPTNDSLTGTAATMVSLFQTGSTALRAIKSSSWYARPTAAAYFIAGF